MSHNLPKPVMGSTGGSIHWGENKFDRLCRNYDERTGELIRHTCDHHRTRRNLNGPCPFVHPNDPRWLQLGGGGLSSPPSQGSSPPVKLAPPARRPFPSINKPPQQPERLPPLTTQIPSGPGGSIVSPMSQISGTIDPRRRPSNASSTAGTESIIDLIKIQAQLQDPSFVAVLEHAVGRSNSGSQPPTPTVSAPPGGVASSWGPGANQAHPQAPSQPPHPAKDAWHNTTAPTKPRGQRSPQRRESQAWQSSASSSDLWGTKVGPSANSSWANASSSSALPSDSWGSASAGDWGASLAHANWGPQPTATPAQTWPTSAAPPPEKPTFEVRSTLAAPPMPPSTSSSSRGNIDTALVASNALPPSQHVSHETPAPNEPPRRPNKLPLTITSSLQSNKPTSEAQNAPPARPVLVDEPPPSPDKLYDSSKPGDDPELVAWRAIIKELGSVYRDYVQYQELAEQRSESEALAQRAAARSRPKPETGAGQADGGPYSGKIKELKEQMRSLSLKQATRAAEWAAASTGGPSTAVGSSQLGEAAVLVDKRSKALWPFEPPEGEYIPKGQANAKATADLESTRDQIQKMAETLDEARSELDRIYADLINEMQESAPESDVGNAVAEPSTAMLSDGPETPDSLLDSDPAEELRHLESEVDRLCRDVEFIVSERHSMWEDAHAALGLEKPGEEEEEGEEEGEGEEEEETRSPTSDNTAPPKVVGQDVNSEVDGDEMNVDGRTEATTDEMEDEAKPSPRLQEEEDPSMPTRESIETKLTDAEGLLDATALRAGPLIKAIDNLVMEEMCQADIALLVASNEDLKARMHALEDQGRAEDVQLQQLYGAVMALDTGGQPNVDQLIDGIVKPVVDEVEAYMRREFGQRARTRDQAWQAVGNQLETLMEPTILVLRAILDKADTVGRC